MEAYTLSGMKRLEDRGITDCIVGFRNAYEKDTTPLQQKIDALRGYADRIIAKLWPGPTCVRASRRPTRRMGGSNFLKARPPKTPMKLAIIASALVVVIVSVAGAGYLAVRGIGAVAGTALTWLEPAVRSALPAEIARAEIQQRLDRTLALVRDGQLDGAEIEILAGKLDRVIAAPAPAPTPQAEG
jgi:hypothetical protein